MNENYMNGLIDGAGFATALYGAVSGDLVLAGTAASVPVLYQAYLTSRDILLTTKCFRKVNLRTWEMLKWFLPLVLRDNQHQQHPLPVGGLTRTRSLVSLGRMLFRRLL